MSRAPLVAILVCLGAIGAPASALGAGVRTGPDGPATGDGQWVMPSKDYAATRYSALEQITVGNARSLHPVWTFSTGVLGGHEGQPLVVGDGETTTMAPLVVKDRVIVGASGGEFGIYGWVKGLDLASGRIVWTARNVGPDAQMLARTGEFKPPYVSGADLGAGSWAGDSWRTGGAPVWGWVSYDPELDLIYYGTGNASPYNPEQRLGDNKWSASVL